MAELIQFTTVFLEGLISFFSPCVIPLIPLYMSYLAGGGEKKEDGTIVYNRKTVLFHTLFFTLGISMSFFILGFSFSGIGTFFRGNHNLFQQISGILIVILGLFQLGIIKIKFLQKERKLKLSVRYQKMNPLNAFFMGFLFSFAWTPCVGPALSSVLIMAGNTTSMLLGNLYVLCYAIGFLIPFLLLGLFTTQVLNFLKNKQSILKNVVKIGGVLLIIMGGMIFLSGYDTAKKGTQLKKKENKKSCQATTDGLENCSAEVEEHTGTKDILYLPSFSLKDAENKTYTSKDYKNKIIILNFWSTECSVCKKELPNIQKVYEKYKENKEDVIVLTVLRPKTKEFSSRNEKTKSEIQKYLKKNKYTFPVLLDETGELFQKFEVISYPNFFIFNQNGFIHKKVPGAITKKDLVKEIEILKNEKTDK